MNYFFQILAVLTVCSCTSLAKNANSSNVLGKISVDRVTNSLPPTTFWLLGGGGRSSVNKNCFVAGFSSEWVERWRSDLTLVNRFLRAYINRHEQSPRKQIFSDNSIILSKGLIQPKLLFEQAVQIAQKVKIRRGSLLSEDIRVLQQNKRKAHNLCAEVRTWSMFSPATPDTILYKKFLAMVYTELERIYVRMLHDSKKFLHKLSENRLQRVTQKNAKRRQNSALRRSRGE